MNKFDNIKKIIVRKPLKLDCGVTISNYPLAYETYGELNQNKDKDLIRTVRSAGYSLDFDE